MTEEQANKIVANLSNLDINGLYMSFYRRSELFQYVNDYAFWFLHAIQVLMPLLVCLRALTNH